MLADLSESPGLTSGTHVECFTYNSSSRGFNPLFWHSWASVLMCACMHTVSCMPNPRHTDSNNNLETLVCLLCTVQEGGINSFWKEVFVGEATSGFVVFWKEQATVGNFCTHWSIVYKYFCLDQKALPAPTSLRHWLLSITHSFRTLSTPYTLTQSFLCSPHSHTEGMHIHINK